MQGSELAILAAVNPSRVARTQLLSLRARGTQDVGEERAGLWRELLAGETDFQGRQRLGVVDEGRDSADEVTGEPGVDAPRQGRRSILIQEHDPVLGDAALLAYERRG